MPTIGRGGAGNIQPIVEADARTSADLEANQPAVDASASASATDPTTLPSREPQLYAHTGRGGSGNYYSPRVLQETGRFNGAERSHVLGDGTPAPVMEEEEQQQKREVVRTYGRGGAGNFLFGATEREAQAAGRQEAREAAVRERVKVEVEKGVRESLAMPAKAKLADGEPY